MNRSAVAASLLWRGTRFSSASSGLAAPKRKRIDWRRESAISGGILQIFQIVKYFFEGGSRNDTPFDVPDFSDLLRTVAVDRAE